ncbi:MAG: glycoside hydrolase family 3 C-terminal domain-containing protein [Phycisphaeraceae bacterium]
MPMTPPSSTHGHDYLNPGLPVETRVEDLLGRMTLEEKCSQMLFASPAIDRLGVPAYNWWNECLHGVARAGRATVFPQAIGLAATFDPALVERVAAAISDEARAKHHEAVRRGNRGIYRGLTFWTPNINIFRDPRWGRGQETYGEDPFLTARMGTAFVRGLQGDDPKYLKVAACAKHFAVHSGPERDRHHFDATASAKDLWETYLPAFKALVDAGVEAVMSAYNRVNGEPASASHTLLDEILRRRWGFKGHVVSDCGAIRDIHENHKLAHSLAEAAAMAVRAGCDLNCGCAYNELIHAVRQGLVDEKDIDRSVRRLLRTRFRLGMFDPPEAVPYARTPMRVVNCEEHQALARRAASASMVLLKNRHGVLPIRPGVRRILIVGPNAASTDVLLGTYFGLSPRIVSFLEGVCARADEGVTVEYRVSCLLDRDNLCPVDITRDEVKNADLVIAVMGLSPLMEGEECDAIASPWAGDRQATGLPENQKRFIERITGLGTPVVMVLTGGSAMSIPREHELADAVLYTWYPGEQGGNALADVLFGDVSPAGRLPITVPFSEDDLPPFDDYAMTGRTYRYMTKPSLYPFGFGLSYARFEYRDLVVAPADSTAGEPISVSVTVQNVSERAGDEVVQVYVKVPEGSAETPRFSLVDFKRVSLQPGESSRLNWRLTAEVLSSVEAGGSSRVRSGTYQVWVGGCSPDARSVELGADAPLTATFGMT